VKKKRKLPAYPPNKQAGKERKRRGTQGVSFSFSLFSPYFLVTPVQRRQKLNYGAITSLRTPRINKQEKKGKEGFQIHVEFLRVSHLSYNADVARFLLVAAHVG
jgi:hypothetical protein